MQVDELLTSSGSKLRALLGERIDQALVVFYEPWGLLHAATPVVLRIGQTQLELWSIYLADFGITLNTIDLGALPFAWIGRPDPDSVWRDADDSLLAGLVGRNVAGLRLIVQEGGLCSGVEIEVSGGQSAFVANLFDDLHVSAVLPEGRGFRLIPVE